MTQDVQPLTWQKKTNIEEHMQFFSKINEIIANLAPTVDEAEQAIAQATQALADANAAIGTANAASAAADAAAQSAQASAATVAGYNTRLTAVEGEADANAANIEALQGRMGTAEGKITAIEGREADYLKKAGAAQTVTSQIMVPTTATGLRDTQIANGTRIQNDLDAYEPMLRTSGNQDYSGLKRLVGDNRFNNYGPYPGVMMICTRVTYGGPAVSDPGVIILQDANGFEIGRLRWGYRADSTTYLQVKVKNGDGTDKYVMLAEGTP